MVVHPCVCLLPSSGSHTSATHLAMGVLGLCSWIQCYIGSGDLDSTPQTWEANGLPFELSPQLRVVFFFGSSKGKTISLLTHVCGENPAPLRAGLGFPFPFHFRVIPASRGYTPFFGLWPPLSFCFFL